MTGIGFCLIRCSFCRRTGDHPEQNRTKLLRTFVWNPGITLSRERLMEILWTDGAKFVEENALSVAVNRLRHKLSGKGDYRPIETVYGIGYVWEKKA